MSPKPFGFLSPKKTHKFHWVMSCHGPPVSLSTLHFLNNSAGAAHLSAVAVSPAADDGNAAAASADAAFAASTLNAAGTMLVVDCGLTH
jgi:hypothetical protein